MYPTQSVEVGSYDSGSGRSVPQKGVKSDADSALLNHGTESHWPTLDQRDDPSLSDQRKHRCELGNLLLLTAAL
jgi:hypothetical protein